MLIKTVVGGTKEVEVYSTHYFGEGNFGTNTKVTKVLLTVPGKKRDNYAFEGIAVKHPNDRPDRWLGLKVAFRRAVKKAQRAGQISQEEKIELWEKLFVAKSHNYKDDIYVDVVDMEEAPAESSLLFAETN